MRHDTVEVANLVNLYALVSRMRILSSPRIVENADRVVRMIIETYLAPNKTFRDLQEILDNEAMDPLREFSNACREELRERGASLAGLRSLQSRMARHAAELTAGCLAWRMLGQRLCAGRCPTWPCSRLPPASASLRPPAAAEGWRWATAIRTAEEAWLWIYMIASS